MNQRGAMLMVGACLATVVPLNAEAPPTPTVFAEILDVRVINVEVVVEDPAGTRVEGLGPGDFHLLVDGVETPIEYFTEVRGRRAITSTGEGPGALPQLTAGEAVGTNYLVFLDDYFAIALDRDRVLAEITRQVAQLGPADQMAIVAFDGKRLELLSGWTASVPSLTRVLAAAAKRPAGGLKRRIERQALDRNGTAVNRSAVGSGRRGTDLADLDLGGSTSVAGPQLVLKEYVVNLTRQVERTVNAAAAALRGTPQAAGSSGRRVMLLLSGGWPLDPLAYALGRPPSPGEYAPGLKRGDRLLEPLVDTANRLGYTVYPVDVPGLVGSGPNVEDETFDPEKTFDFRQLEVHAALQNIATATGGRPLLNSLRDQALERVKSDLQSYYWLGFTPTRQGDDRAHTIRVVARRPGLQVRAREGYLDLSLGGEVNLMVESALLFDSAPPSDPLPVKLGEPKRSGRGTMDVPLSVAVPVDQLTFLAAGSAWRSRAELRVGAIDEDGENVEVASVPLDLELPAAPSPGSFTRFDTSLHLRRKNHRLVIALYEPLTGKVLTTTATVAKP